MVNFGYGDRYCGFLYDAVLIYAIALNETMTKGLNYRSGAIVAAELANKMYIGLCCSC